MESKCGEDFGDGIPPVNRNPKLTSAIEEFYNELDRKRRQKTYSFRKFFVQSRRRETFENWTDFSDVEVETLIDAGFCYLGLSDACICPWCECVVSGWKKRGQSFNKTR